MEIKKILYLTFDGNDDKDIKNFNKIKSKIYIEGNEDIIFLVFEENKKVLEAILNINLTNIDYVKIKLE